MKEEGEFCGNVKIGKKNDRKLKEKKKRSDDNIL